MCLIDHTMRAGKHPNTKKRQNFLWYIDKPVQVSQSNHNWFYIESILIKYDIHLLILARRQKSALQTI
jgi:hypothetical protein